ncbi:protein kinase domain-containing protein [Ornithinimicrobium cerasi]|uniref:non-specific serine/threonine protein kinase n=1 Tax=Ornithinimicrobium cerasi TaxID=2248773 RepID=A0A285VAP1_9MICO|nr:protein kinase [Ornithinimicrobium cerasi]SOC51159.1 Serine/threonine protein kinase [Ornithinimicrobium cerasi]
MDDWLDGRYELRGRLGSGGMATVFEYFDHKERRPVAIKVLGPDATPELKPRLRREALTAARLKHPHIVRTYGGKSHDSSGIATPEYIAMELVRGQTLKQHVEAQGALPLLEALRITLQILEAVRYAHAMKVLHRDLTPSNIMLDEQGAVKVMDFGIARSLDAEVTRTGTNELWGAVRCMSPERLTNDRAADERSDLYSIACILYYSLTARYPFPGDDTQVAYAHLHHTPPPPSRHSKEISHVLDRIIARALEKSPALRFQSAKDFLSDLQAEYDAIQARISAQGDATERFEAQTRRVETDLSLPPYVAQHARDFDRVVHPPPPPPPPNLADRTRQRWQQHKGLIHTIVLWGLPIATFILVFGTPFRWDFGRQLVYEHLAVPTDGNFGRFILWGSVAFGLLGLLPLTIRRYSRSLSATLRACAISLASWVTWLTVSLGLARLHQFLYSLIEIPDALQKVEPATSTWGTWQVALYAFSTLATLVALGYVCLAAMDKLWKKAQSRLIVGLLTASLPPLVLIVALSLDWSETAAFVDGSHHRQSAAAHRESGYPVETRGAS